MRVSKGFSETETASQNEVRAEAVRPVPVRSRVDTVPNTSCGPTISTMRASFNVLFPRFSVSSVGRVNFSLKGGGGKERHRKRRKTLQICVLHTRRNNTC
jgi:hypothetical protein